MRRLIESFILVWALVLVAGPVASAQLRADDFLDQMPAPNTREAFRVFNEMLAAGPPVIEEILAELVPTGAGDDNKARYAVSGLAKHVSQAGMENERAMVAGVLAEALGSDADAEVKAFLLAQLQQCGGDEVVKPVSAFLDHDRLESPAVQTLMTIGSAKASAALEAARKNAEGGRAERLALAVSLLDKAPPPTPDADGEEKLDALFALFGAKRWEDGFRGLFNGKNLAGWLGDRRGYAVEDGAIVCNKGGKLYTKPRFSDFVLRFKFKLEAGANNGLGIRMDVGDHAAYDAMELQVLDNTAEKHADLEPYQYHGSIYGVAAAKRGHLKPAGEWNEQEVLAEGSHIRVTLNGEVILDTDLRPYIENGTPDDKDHPGLANKEGHIGFLGHGTRVWFKDLRIREL